MKHGCKHMGALILLLLISCVALAQVSVRATVSRDKILIGESVDLTIEAYMPLGTTIEWIKPDSIPHFLVIERSRVDTAENIDGKKISQQIIMTSFDSGRWQLPPFEIMVQGQPFYTDSVTIDVGFTPFDVNADYRDIKDIIEVINDDVKYIPWLIAGLAALSLAALIYFMKKRKEARQVIVPAGVPQLSPYEEAMASLKLLSHKTPETAEVKTYYSELNDILRNYLFRQFRITTFERTNEELIIHLYDLQLSKDAYTRLVQSLRMSDFVKFAKYRPADEETVNNLSSVKESIDMLDKKEISAV